MCLQLETDTYTTAAFKKWTAVLGMVVESNCISFSKLVGPVVLEVEVLSAEHISEISPTALRVGCLKLVTTTDHWVTGKYGHSVHSYKGKALWAEYHSQQKKGMLYNTFQTKQHRSHQLQICFENSQLLWGESAASIGDHNPFSSYPWQPFCRSFYHNSQNLCCTSYLGSLGHNKS